MLSKAAIKVLRMIVEDEEDLFCSNGECWVGYHRTTNKVLNELLRLCLIKNDSVSENYYGPTSEAKEILNNPNYIPEIIRILRKRNET